MNKVAFISMDVESFYDTSCIRKCHVQKDEKYDSAEMVRTFLNLLNKYNVKATFFVTVDFLPRCKEILFEAINAGHEIAFHCLDHDVKRYKSDFEFENSVIKAKKILFEELGVKVVGNRFPCFEGNDKKIDIIKNNGFIYDSGSKIIDLSGYQKVQDGIYLKDDFYEFTLAPSRFLLNKINISGGGYLRLIPWGIVYRKVKKYIKNHDSYCLYVHPFEINPITMPNYKGMNLFERLFVKRGRKDYLNKIERIINLLKEENFELITFKDYIERNK